MNKTQAWIKSFRPRTLPLAVAGVAMGNGLAAMFFSFNIWVCLLSLITAVLLQILSNLANDYGDFQHGADTGERIGELRGMQHGLISAKEMRNMLFVFTGLCLISGVSLLIYTFPNAGLLFWIFLLLGIGAILAAIKYTVGKNPYGYAGLGELSVFIFFGLVSVGGTFFLQAAVNVGFLAEFLASSTTLKVKLLPGPLLAATMIGCWSAGVLNINNIRDMATDAKAGKRTLALRLGLRGARVLQTVLIGGGVFAVITFNLLYRLHIAQWIALLPCLLLLINLREVWSQPPSPAYNKLLKQLSLSTLLFVIVFVAAQIYAISELLHAPATGGFTFG